MNLEKVCADFTARMVEPKVVLRKAFSFMDRSSQSISKCQHHQRRSSRGGNKRCLAYSRYSKQKIAIDCDSGAGIHGHCNDLYRESPAIFHYIKQFPSFT